MSNTSKNIWKEIVKFVLASTKKDVQRFMVRNFDEFCKHKEDEQFLKDFLAKLIKMDKFNC